MNASRAANWLSPFILLTAVALAYWPGLTGGFLFDDYANILTNSRIQVESLDPDSLQRAAKAYEPGAYGRPLATLSFAFDYYLGGKDPWGYKLSGLLVHLVNTLLVYLLARRLLSLPAAQGPWHPWAATAIAAFWALHPLQVSTVLYVVQRMETMAATFVLLGLLAYLRGRLKQIGGGNGWPWLVASGALAAIGMLSKESAVLFPAYALALEVTVLRFEAGTARASRLLKWLYGLGLLGGAIVFFGYVVPHYASPESYSNRDFDMAERLLSQMRVLPLYLGQMLLPLPRALTFYYDTFPASTGLFSPWTTAAGGVLLALLLAVAWRARRAAPLFSLGVLWFFAGHSLTSNVLNLELVFEHRNYFALLGVTLAVADLVRRIPMRDGPALKTFAVVVIVGLFGILGTIRSATWGDRLLLASDLVAKNPDSPRASSDLATLYVGMSDGNPNSPFYSFGAQEFERGSRLPGASPLPEQGLILMAATTGQPVNEEWWDRLVHKIRTQPPGPQQSIAVIGLMTQFRRGVELDPKRLGETYQALLDRDLWPAHMYAEFGDFALNELDDQDLADRMFVMAVKRDPSDLQFAALVLSTLIEEGHQRQVDAVSRALKEIAADPDQAPPAEAASATERAPSI